VVPPYNNTVGNHLLRKLSAVLSSLQQLWLSGRRIAAGAAWRRWGGGGAEVAALGGGGRRQMWIGAKTWEVIIIGEGGK